MWRMKILAVVSKRMKDVFFFFSFLLLNVGLPSSSGGKALQTAQ